MTSKKHHRRVKRPRDTQHGPNHDEERKKVIRRHTILSAIAFFVCIVVAVYTTDKYTETAASEIAKIVAAGLFYWRAFGELEL